MIGSLELRPRPTTENIEQTIDYRPEALKNGPSLRIDSLALPRVDFIKIDVEGMEMALLDGARETIRLRKPYVLVEHVKTGSEHLIAWLEAASYRWWGAGVNILAFPDGDPALPRLPPRQ